MEEERYVPWDDRGEKGEEMDGEKGPGVSWDDRWEKGDGIVVGEGDVSWDNRG